MSRLPVEEAQRLARGNQRVTVRYRCAPATAGKLFVADDDHEFQRAWVMNISKTGIGLTLGHPLLEGTIILLQVRNTITRAYHDMSAHVAHATLVNQTDWLIGCELITPLTEDELEALL